MTSASRIIGKREIDLESDPPPDVAVEIDTESRFFPGLTPTMIADFFDAAKHQGQTKALAAFRKRSAPARAGRAGRNAPQKEISCLTRHSHPKRLGGNFGDSEQFLQAPVFRENRTALIAANAENRTIHRPVLLFPQ